MENETREVEIGGEKGRQEADVDSSGYDRLSMIWRHVGVFRVLRVGIAQSGKVIEIPKACGPVISYVGFV
jgi:hypothetical protein